MKSLNEIVNGYTDDEGTVVKGVVARLDDLVATLPTTYVTVADFNAVVGNLE
ncbi:MAG: hypothetical protein IJ341_10455 [Bacteroidales bacterium]|nr:hypothetical protein [Bacteroidales bacterium]